MSFGIFQFRRGLSIEWQIANPILLDGELGLETDTSLFKIGNGVDNWNTLSYGGISGKTKRTYVHGAVAEESSPVLLYVRML